MSQNVILKSFPNGISLYLDAEAPFDVILQEIIDKFLESGNFFKNAKVALSFEGRQLTDKQEHEIVRAISENSTLKINCIIGKDDEKNQLFVKALKHTEKHDESHYAQFFRGNLKDHEILETDRSVVIIGDVYPGCAVTSPKDIIILGGLYGEAYAGGNGEDGHYVVALDMQPEKLKIGDVVYKNEKVSKWSIKPKFQGKIAYVKKGKVVTEVITKELLNELN